MEIQPEPPCEVEFPFEVGTQLPCLMENLPEDFINLYLSKDEKEEEDDGVNFWEKPGDFWTDKQKEECRRVEKYLKELNLVEKKDDGDREKESRTAWKPSEIDFFLHISVMLDMKVMNILAGVHQKMLPLKQGRKEGVRAHNKLMAHFRHYFPDYHKFRLSWEAFKDLHFPWMAGNSYTTFEDISPFEPMKYTDAKPPSLGSSRSLQIYSVKVVGEPVQPKKKRKVAGSSTQWPLKVFGVVAVRDRIDPRRNLIFYRDRDNCQIITEENPFLELIGPTRAVGMNADVMIEAELKVKGAVEREDKYLIADGRKISPGSISHSVHLTSPGDEWTLCIAAEELETCVEATIFIKAVNGTWPVGYGGRFSAVTWPDCNTIILAEFNGDNVTSSGVLGDMEQSRHVVSVEASGMLGVVLQAYEGGYKGVRFQVQMSGRSFCYVELCSCKFGVLVVWSRIEPCCGDMLSSSEKVLIPVS